jgi:hypothetical protein
VNVDHPLRYQRANGVITIYQANFAKGIIERPFRERDVVPA